MLDIIAMEEQFTGEYKRAFSKISMYGTMTPLDYDKYEDRVLNIYDMLIAAQTDGKPVEKIIGRDIELFCMEYYKNHDKYEWIRDIFKRIFRIMLVLFGYSVIELCLALAENAGITEFTSLQVNAAPIIIGLAVGLIVICIENIAKRKVLFETDKVKNGIYAVGVLIIFAICIAVGVVVFGDVGVRMPLWLVLSISGGYSLMYLIVSNMVKYKKNGSFKNTDKVSRKELKQFKKDITLDYDIRTSAEAMVQRFDKMKKKYEKKGKSEPTFAEFVEVIRKDHKFIKYAEIFFTLLTIGIAVVNILLNIGNEELLIGIIGAVVVAVITFVVFRFAITAMKEVEIAQCIILDECEQKKIDIYEYVNNMQK